MKFNLSEWALSHRTLTVYFMVLTALAGIWSYATLGRDEDPPFTIKTMVVKTVWPGAGPQETLLQITERLEKKLQDLPSLDYLKSYTTAGESVILVTLKDSTPPAKVPDLWYQVRKKTGDIAHELPTGVYGPYFDDEFGDTFGIIYAFTGDGFGPRALRDHAEAVRAELVHIPDVGKTELIGTQDETVALEFSTQRLAGMGISQAAVLQSLKAQNAVTPAGEITAADERFLVRVSGGFADAADLERISLRAGDRFFRLADVATIRRETVDPPQPMFRVNGKPAVGLAVSMAKGGDILKLGQAIHRRMTELAAERPVGIEVTQVADQTEVVKFSVHGFVKSLAEAVSIVLAVSFLSLGLRAGTVVALSIPLVLAATFVGMKVCGIDLQRVSLGALIIALGLLVDDAMITVEMMVKKLEEGRTRHEAAVAAFTLTAFPMLTGTLVTMIGFVPVGFARSATAEYCFSLFAIMALSLLISWGVAVVFSPLIGIAILPERIAPRADGTGERIAAIFRRLLEASLARRWWVIGGTAALFAGSLVLSTRLEHQFFPQSERPELFVDLTLPQNAAVTATAAAAEKLEARLAADPDVASYSIYVGRGAIRFYLPMDVQLDHDYFAQAVVVAKTVEARDALAARLQAGMTTDLPAATVRSSAMELGPPVGWPVKYRLSGPDLQTLRGKAYDLANLIGGHPGMRLINFDWNEPIKTVRATVNQDKARLLGLTSADLAQAFQVTFSGGAVTQMRDGIYLIDVLARGAATERRDLDTLRQLQIPAGGGRSVPLSDVAEISYGFEQPIVWRYDRRPTITVQGDVAPGAHAEGVVKDLAPKIAAFVAALPPGYRLEVGGAVEESAKGNASVAAMLPATALLMLTVLMIQMQSVQRLFLVVSVAPLGLIGVVAAMLLARQPMGFVAMLGCIALVGMIVRNSVILIDQIERDVKSGLDRRDAVIDATCHRMRPILLTASAAILAMIPIATESFWGPMAFAIMGGLVVATLLTLLFLPALYAVWFRVP
jgi:multidrug efflux pump subunit AcrB